jgi:hypothetical protein
MLRCLVIFGFLSLESTTYSQDNNQNIIPTQEHYIYFSEGLGKDVLHNMELTNLTIIVKNELDELVVQLNESTLNEFVFSTPGVFSIELSSDHAKEEDLKECNHLVHNRLISLRVLPYHLKFDFNKTTFSSQLVGDKEMSSALLTIPIEVQTYSKSSIKLGKFKFQTAGINTTLEGETKNENLILNPGVNLISYQMKGKVSENTFIMFDFFDNYGLVQSFGYPIQIK